jgi:hypothetical protein
MGRAWDCEDGTEHADGAEREDRGPILSGVWSAPAVLLQYLRTWAG